MDDSQPLNLVSFDTPWPPDYGGVLDVYHKLRTLHALGVPVILHHFAYGPRGTEEPPFCWWIERHVYPRKEHWTAQLSLEPYISRSRREPRLLTNLAAQKGPILFEGMHSLSWVGHPRLQHQRQVVRSHNLEHQYYWHLAQDEGHLGRKLYLMAEAARLRLQLHQLGKASAIAAISPTDAAWLENRLSLPTAHIPPFHGNDSCNPPDGLGEGILFHGNLAVAENQQAAHFLLDLAPQLRQPLTLAGRQPSTEIRSRCNRHGVRLVADPDEAALEILIHQAQIHAFPIARGDGAKLKLLRSCFQGRHCLVHPAVVAGSPLESLCRSAVSPEDWLEAFENLNKRPLNALETQARAQVFSRHYDNRVNAKKLLELVYPQS